MSESSGGGATFSAGSPAGNSRTTFTAPSSATTGLQAYSLQRRILRLYPGTTTRPRLHQRDKRAARNHAGRALALSKDGNQMQAQIAEMVQTLKTSVGDIVAAGGTDTQELLAKGFTEFQAAMDQVANDAEQAVADAVNDNEGGELFKGLGTVSRVCSLVGMIAGKVDDIKAGRDYRGQNDDEPNDPCSDAVGEMLDHLVAVGELAMRVSVNEHVELPDDNFTGDVEKGTFVCELPLSKDASVTLLTDIDPEGEHAELLKFVTSPDDLQEFAVTAGCGLLLDGGVDEGSLEKMFSGGDLLKFAPGDPAAAPAPGGADPAADPAGGAMADDGADPITIAGRLCAALMIQISHLHDIVMGGNPSLDGGDPSADGADPAAAPGGGDPAGDPEAVAAAPQPKADAKEEDPKKKGNPFAKVDGADELQKAADMEKMVADRVEAALAPLRPQLEKMLAQPQPMRGFAGPAELATLLTKAADTGALGGADADPLSDANLAKMSPEAKSLALTKRALRAPTAVDPRNR